MEYGAVCGGHMLICSPTKNRRLAAYFPSTWREYGMPQLQIIQNQCDKQSNKNRFSILNQR